MRFRLIGSLTVRFAASEDHSDQALLLSPWSLSSRQIPRMTVRSGATGTTRLPHYD